MRAPRAAARTTGGFGAPLGLLAALLLPLGAVSADEVGKVLFAGAGATVERAGAVSAIARGDALAAGDVLVTAQGRMQLKFADGATVSLAPQSRFRIDAYAWGSGAERGVFSLLRGAIRAVTGAIGKTRREDYRVDTAVATIGIRGTAYSAQLCQGDCTAGSKPDGLHLATSAGIVSLTNAAGTLDVPAGSSAYVADARTAPRLDGPAPEAASIPAPGGEAEFRAGESMIEGGHDDGGHPHAVP